MLRVAILQHADSVILDEGIRGTMDALAERGFRDGERLKIDHFNAQGDMPTGMRDRPPDHRRRLRPRDHVQHTVDAGRGEQQS